MDKVFCEICGNEVATFDLLCPFCSSKLNENPSHVQGPRHRVVNLKKGLPLVKQALEKMKQELCFSQKQGCRVVTFIHGYGASGKGGVIKDEVRRQLKYLMDLGQIKEVVSGESLSKRSGQRRHLFKRFPYLLESGEFNGENPGITLVIL